MLACLLASLEAPFSFFLSLHSEERHDQMMRASLLPSSPPQAIQRSFLLISFLCTYIHSTEEEV